MKSVVMEQAVARDGMLYVRGCLPTQPDDFHSEVARLVLDREESSSVWVRRRQNMLDVALPGAMPSEDTRVAIWAKLLRQRPGVGLQCYDRLPPGVARAPLAVNVSVEEVAEIGAEWARAYSRAVEPRVLSAAELMEVRGRGGPGGVSGAGGNAPFPTVLASASDGRLADAARGWVEARRSSTSPAAIEAASARLERILVREGLAS